MNVMYKSKHLFPNIFISIKFHLSFVEAFNGDWKISLRITVGFKCQEVTNLYQNGPFFDIIFTTMYVGAIKILTQIGHHCYLHIVPYCKCYRIFSQIFKSVYQSYNFFCTPKYQKVRSRRQKKLEDQKVSKILHPIIT